MERPPKNYVVVRIPKQPGEQKAWELRYPDMPFVLTRPKKVYFESTPCCRHLARLLSLKPSYKFSADDVKESGCGYLNNEMAEALLEYLRFKASRPDFRTSLEASDKQHAEDVARFKLAMQGPNDYDSATSDKPVESEPYKDHCDESPF